MALNKNGKVMEFGSWDINMWESSGQRMASYARNEVIFNAKSFYFAQVVCLIRARIAAWSVAKWPDIAASFDDVVRCPNFIATPLKLRKQRMASVWEVPPPGFVKFNVDGFALGNPGPAGIGGVLCNDAGDILLMFSKPIGIEDSNIVEFLAVVEAFSIFAESCRASSLGLIVESDSLVTVNWINSPQAIPWRLKKRCPFVTTWQSRILVWQIHHVLREKNTIADGLAKAAVSRCSPLFLVL
ncbi:hypothetical protein REPUB_Repub16aG0050400 [Reevesia pubescens]